MYFTESNQRRRSDKTQNEKEATINLTNKQKKEYKVTLFDLFRKKKNKRKIEEKKTTKPKQTKNKRKIVIK